VVLALAKESGMVESVKQIYFVMKSD